MEVKPEQACAIRACTIEAPCKINLHLKIRERRPDGFHTLESLFATLAHGDTLRFECSGEKGDCHLFMTGQAIPAEANLVLRAVSLFRERTGFMDGLRVRLDKRIPIGAGLGGGSSDAASTLLALNSLAGGQSGLLAFEELRELAMSLGSDVPFFLTGGTAFVSGRGECIEPVESPQGLWVVLVKPPFSSDTARAFRLLDEAREHGMELSQKTLSKEAVLQKGLSKKGLIQALKADPETWPFYNDFLPVFLCFNSSLNEEQELQSSLYKAILKELQEKGASFTGLSGSGSCCFGIFKAAETAKRAEKELNIGGNYVRLTFFLARNTGMVLE